MARYTGSFKVSTLDGNPQHQLSKILESCNFSIVYQTGDYLMAREAPGRVAYHQLVTTEILVDRTTASDQTVQVNLVIKNEELPLHKENHCAQIYQKVTQAIMDAREWQRIETISI